MHLPKKCLIRITHEFNAIYAEFYAEFKNHVKILPNALVTHLKRTFYKKFHIFIQILYYIPKFSCRMQKSCFNDSKRSYNAVKMWS